MNLPDTFAGGQFDLPLKVAKIVRQAKGSEGERQAANTVLRPLGYFVDRAGIVWDIDKIPDFARDEPTTNTEEIE